MPKLYTYVALVAGLAAGYGLNEIDLFSTAQAAPANRSAIISKVLGTAASNTLESFLVIQVCPEIDLDFGTNDCDATMFRESDAGLYLRHEPNTNGVDKWHLHITIDREGQWVPN